MDVENRQAMDAALKLLHDTVVHGKDVPSENVDILRQICTHPGKGFNIQTSTISQAYNAESYLVELTILQNFLQKAVTNQQYQMLSEQLVSQELAVTMVIILYL